MQKFSTYLLWGQQWNINTELTSLQATICTGVPLFNKVPKTSETPLIPEFATFLVQSFPEKWVGIISTVNVPTESLPSFEGRAHFGCECISKSSVVHVWKHDHYKPTSRGKSITSFLKGGVNRLPDQEGASKANVKWNSPDQLKVQWQ